MPIPDLIGPGSMSEDCLVLNLWSPSLHGSNRPVMVWLHGGAYSIGSSGAPMYDGANLAAKHNVVVVGVNHRLNVFGFLYLGKIEGESYADSGNVGMLDIVLALRWIRDNIAQFGGDPGNVTIFGQSGGGGKVSALMAMPDARGLFHKAIVQSGSEIRVNTSEEADEAARKFLAHIGVENSRLNQLAEMPMDRLIAEMHSMTDPDPMNTFGPVVDSRSLPGHPFDPGAPAVSANVPMIIGTNLTETTNLLGLHNPGLFSLTESQLRPALKTALGLPDSKLDPLIDACRKDLPGASPGQVYFAVTTDQMMRNDAITQAERKTAQVAAPAYMYLFSWPTPVWGGKLQSPHGIEIPFVFENLREAQNRIGTGSDLPPLADRVSGAWVAFARTGNPNHPGIPLWPPYSLKDRATMIFDDQCKVAFDPGKEQRLAFSSQ
jgi:para-nitrobenzyl esterase